MRALSYGLIDGGPRAFALLDVAQGPSLADTLAAKP